MLQRQGQPRAWAETGYWGPRSSHLCHEAAPSTFFPHAWPGWECAVQDGNCEAVAGHQQLKIHTSSLAARRLKGSD